MSHNNPGFIVFVYIQHPHFLVLSFNIAFILWIVLLGVVILLCSRGKTAEGNLQVLDATPTGDAVVNAIVREMLVAGESRKTSRWFSSQETLGLRAKGLYKIIERRLAKKGWITLTGKRRVLRLFEVEMLVINCQTEQWQE